jgi:hypothetical protein
MTDYRPDHDTDHHRHAAPSPIVEPGEIDGGVTPQQELGKHPAEGVENQHDLETDILPVDATADDGPRTTGPRET